MRLIKQNIERDGSGTATLFPEESEDMWHAYNLIATGDELRASAIRRVTTESATGSTSSHRVHITLSVVVRSIDFDPQVGQLHVNGQVTEENQWVRVGAFHTLDLELRRNFTIAKKDGWDSVALEALKEAIKEEKEGTVPAIVMDEGMANICLITENRTILKQRVEVAVAKKRAGRSADHDKGMVKFFDISLDALKRHFDITQPRPVLIASPGFIAAGFLKYILDDATRAGNKSILGNKKNFVVIHSSSGHLHSLNEVLKSPEVLARLKDTKYAKETQLMDKFLELLRKDNGKAWYGPSEVIKAVEQGAVGQGGGTLLINHSLFRSQEIGERKKWVSLVDKVKENGGDARILSGDHESGKRLESLGGIAAILTYPLFDLDEDE
ncbi:hypothetical protein K3495_g948 [Podosphaera aphanis]|nr:hypothetical protein K3495_g948 [Podosphaera aphanis]